ncbi:LPXTG cell wall anchor domain-containing protein [Enterococcus sp. 5H]|uniref:LPXTG cell wall anchor domain-containing protein n=1 Tax=Enterococcus sp. 5H TaxID=1229490 RepID=UPI0023026A45|nr:LPXTG cell wall anchor domain-containing protein [Enterococcus sp. 5H]
MRTNKLIIIFCSLIVLMSASLWPVIVYGTEGAGGQVNTDGKISFYDEEVESDESTPIETDKPESSLEDDDSAKKPAGNLPSTGERMGNFGFIGIALVLLVFLLVMLRKWTNKEER